MSTFGSEFEQIWPKSDAVPNLTNFGTKLLKQCANIKKPEQKQVDINEFINKSANFPLKFAIDTCRVMSQPQDRYTNIQQQIASAYPVIHERVLQLYLAFLEYKCKYGSNVEKQLYHNFTLSDLVQRLLTKRCALFVGFLDHYFLVSGERGYGTDYIAVGTDSEKEPLVLSKCLSYDEVKLSAFLSVSSYTELINNGNRNNRGIPETDLTKIEREGVVVGLIGARFQRPEVMDYQDIVISPQQNIEENGYGNKPERMGLSKFWHGLFGPKLPEYRNQLQLREYRKLWQQFYEELDFLYSDVPKENPRFGSLGTHGYFDNVVMKKRFTISFDTLLLETQSRAAAANKQAYLHIVGIGLGVWRAAEQQTYIFLKTFMDRVQALKSVLNNVGVLHFTWFREDDCEDVKNNGFVESATHPKGGIRTLMSNRNPAEKLGEEYENMLLVISYAWDGNALPGNEFWDRQLNHSSDSSNASSTLVTELHNGHINTEWVCGDNLHVASAKHGCVHISEFARILLKNV